MRIERRMVPIIGQIAAGKPILADEHIEAYLPCEVTKDLHEFSDRLFSKYSYNNNSLIQSTFDVISSAIDKWYPIV